MNLADSPTPDHSNSDRYQVVALRYRPQSFEALVGQGHIATALSNAITQNRVGHAYLFTGARGVGKTSSARIFAKCLNCQQGPTTTPCNECDICQSISSGEDVDVLEIDGASNRGIDEIRQLRSNVAVRPSRSRFKVYIIDEVHMLTTQAFNALLKTLEEPPEHVKFIFCTTDPQKIPITVLSRCQRFDFSPVQTDQIAGRLREIAQSENVETDDAALQLLARRANGSMRDSQSLLEQLFSFCGDKISVDEVHQLLGTTDMGRIVEIATAITAKQTSTALTLVHQNLSSGVNAGQLAEQLLGYFRDMMAVRVGCNEDTLLNCSASEMQALKSQADELGLETILSIVQVFDQAIVRMQTSMHARTLLEVAAVRACGLEHVESIATLVKSLANAGDVTVNTGGETTSADSKKKVIPDPAATAVHVAADPPSGRDHHEITEKQPLENQSSLNAAVSTPPPGHEIPKPTPASSPAPHPTTNGKATTSLARPAEIYRQAVESLKDMTTDMASEFEKVEHVDDKLVVTLLDSYNVTLCSKPDRKARIETALAQSAGQPLRVEFIASQRKPEPAKQAKPKLNRIQQLRKLQEHDFVKQAIGLFDCEISNFHQE